MPQIFLILALLSVFSSLPAMAIGAFDPALLAAVERGDGARVAAFARKIENFDALEDGSTLMMLAARYGRPLIVNDLLLAGADIDRQNQDGETALLVASRAGKANVVRMLLFRGAEIDHQDRLGRSALKLAMEGEDQEPEEPETMEPEAVEVERVAEEKIGRETVGRGPAAPAMKGGRQETVELLVEAAMSTLAGEARYGNFEAVTLLLSRGADVNVPGIRGRTALMEAAAEEHPEVVEALLAAGADVNVPSAKGWTALMAAAHRGRADFAAAFLGAGAEVDASRLDNGKTALIWAARRGAPHVLRLLLEAGADPTIVDKAGLKAIDYARQKGHAESEAILREAERG